MSEVRPLCRVCLGIGEVSLETLWELEGCAISLLQLLHSYTSIQYMDSWLPQHICLTCLQTVESAHSLSCQYRSSYEQLYDTMVNSSKPVQIRPKSVIKFQTRENKSQTSDTLSCIVQFNKAVVPEINQLVEDNVNHKPKDEIKINKQGNDVESPQESDKYTEEATVHYYMTDSENGENLIEISEEQAQGILLGDILENNSEQSVGDDLTNVCPICGLQLARKYSLRRHMAAAHGKMTMKCRGCRKSFNNMTLFRGHKIKGCQKPNKAARITVKQAREPIPMVDQLKCGVCGKQFTTRNGFQYHMQRHDGPSQEHKCETCARAFSTRVALANHIAAQHSSERPHLCPSCGRGFATTDHLRKHLRLVHGGRRDFLCVRCGQAFQQSSHLKQHLWVHTGIKPYSCKQCGGGYSSKTSLKVHMANIHKDGSIRKAYANVIQDQELRHAT